MTKQEQIDEVAKCLRSPVYFVGRYTSIYDATTGVWIPFQLWPEQKNVLKLLLTHLLVIILKARQLGQSWLVLSFALWLMLFRPASTISIFSRRDDEAVYLLKDRLKEMYKRLPEILRVGLIVLIDNDHEWALSNGSVARAFPTSAGDSYTATLAIADEFDLVEDQGRLMTAVKPTIDGGGRMILLSRVDKNRPESEFKKIYRAAKAGNSPWISVFLPWFIRPERDLNWYETQRSDILARTGAIDDLWEQYPATDTEALSPRMLDKRIPASWLENCFEEMAGWEDLPESTPAIPGLVVYRLPERGKRYVVGMDPAEGNPTSDDSSITVLDRLSGEECAAISGKIQPDTLGVYSDLVGSWYNRADILVERNNHGHAVLLWLKEHSRLKVLLGHDQKPGWHTTAVSKALLYSTGANVFRDRDTRLHSFETYTQLSSVDGNTLSAPEGEHDDRAVSYVLALMARTLEPKRMTSGTFDFYKSNGNGHKKAEPIRTDTEIEMMLNG